MKNKTVFTILCMLLLFKSANASNNLYPDSIAINGVVKNYPLPYIYLITFDADVNRTFDSCKIENEKFKFKINNIGLRECYLKTDTIKKPTDGINSVGFIVDKNDINIFLEYNKFSNIKVSGCKAIDYYNCINKMSNNENWTKEKWDAYLVPYIANNSNDDLAPFLLDKLYINSLSDSLYNMLSNFQKSSFYGKQYLREKDKIKKIESQTNSLAKGFSFTYKSKNYTLSRLCAQNYVLLDFWFCGCAPCRLSFPDLKKTYNKFHTKGFEIVAISVDAIGDTAKWEKAIIKDKTENWLHTLATTTKESKDLSKDYIVSSYPTKILLDKNMRIIGRFATEDELDKKLKELLK